VVASWGQSRHDISTQHPTARAAPVVNSCVGSAPKLEMRRQPHLDSGRGTSRDESPPACAVSAAIEHSRAPWSGPTSGAPSTCNSARLRICESVGMQRFWVGGRCQPRSVLRRSARGPAQAGRLVSEGSARRAARWRTQPSLGSCDVKLALETFVVLERNSETRMEWAGAVRAAHVRGGRRHSGDGRSPR
jgi:hypothetical protein